MTKATKQPILECIRNLNVNYKGHKISTSLIENDDPELILVATYLNCTKEEALLFSVVFALFLKGRDVEVKDLCQFFKSDTFEILPHLGTLDQLIKRKLVIRKMQGKLLSETPFFSSYRISNEVCEALIHNKPCPIQKKLIHKTLIDVFEILHDKIISCLDDELSIEDLFAEIQQSAKTEKKYAFFKKTNALRLPPIDLTLLIYVSWLSITGNRRVDVDRLLRALFIRNADRVKYMQDLHFQLNPLVKNGLIEIKEGRFFNDFDFLITDKVKILLEADGIKMATKYAKRNDIMYPEKITEKSLFYNESEAEQINKLSVSLERTSYVNIAKRLQEKNLKTGLTILLFGEPGTGKTELVYQIARQTGRPIMKVDISNTKSMWFGESEKLIKKLFDDYKAFAATQDQTPILFFNEADAVLAKRKTDSNSSSGNTENAIQNLLLDEFEHFEGILIATTNLTKNLDPAYDRRFLFKIKINNPNQDLRKQIWQDKLTFLHSNALTFEDLSLHPLTGGQIENISKKCEISFILNGYYPTLDEIHSFCTEEQSLSKRSSREIGFGR